MDSVQWTASKLVTRHDPLITALTTSADFLADRERLLYLAEVARRSHCRPSELLELTGMPAYLLDCTTAETVAERERNESSAQENVIEW